VAVREHQLNRIAADRLDGVDADVLLACLQNLLPRPVPAHLRRGRIHAQEFAGKPEDLTVRKGDFQDA
jgi:hypothetical protein